MARPTARTDRPKVMASCNGSGFEQHTPLGPKQHVGAGGVGRKCLSMTLNYLQVSVFHLICVRARSPQKQGVARNSTWPMSISVPQPVNPRSCSIYMSDRGLWRNGRLRRFGSVRRKALRVRAPPVPPSFGCTVSTWGSDNPVRVSWLPTQCYQSKRSCNTLIDTNQRRPYGVR